MRTRRESAFNTQIIAIPYQTPTDILKDTGSTRGEKQLDSRFQSWDGKCSVIRPMGKHALQSSASPPLALPEQTLTSTELQRTVQKQDAPSLSAGERNITSLRMEQIFSRKYNSDSFLFTL